MFLRIYVIHFIYIYEIIIYINCKCKKLYNKKYTKKASCHKKVAQKNTKTHITIHTKNNPQTHDYIKKTPQKYINQKLYDEKHLKL